MQLILGLGNCIRSSTLLVKHLHVFFKPGVHINEFGRFDALKATIDKQKAKAYFEAIEDNRTIPPKVPMKIDKDEPGRPLPGRDTR